MFRTFILWCVLFVLSWPVALAVLILYPVIWVLLLPLRILGMATEAVFKTLRSILLLPSRIYDRALRHGPTGARRTREP